MDDGDKVFVRAPDYVTRNAAGETIIVPVRMRAADLESLYMLNDVGTTIWESIDGKRTVNQIVEIVCEQYDVGPDQARRDVCEFLRTQQADGLIQPAD